MQIEAGKYYHTRDGRKVGPMVNEGWRDGEPWTAPDAHTYWSCTGKWNTRDEGDSPNDLVAEWSEGPVQTETVTKRRIVPGVYGRLRVAGPVAPGVVSIRLDPPKHSEIDWADMTATELDDLAMVASQLAEALRDGLD